MKYSLLLPAILIFILAGCSSSDREWNSNKDVMPSAPMETMEESSATSDEEGGVGIETEAVKTSENPLMSSSAAVENPGDTTGRKFIRTASLRFKVKDVRIATLQIEDIASRFGGFVSFTDLKSTIERTTVVPVSRDSSLETTYYLVSNDITIRVPNVKLDSTLRTLGNLVDFLDFRLIRADDVRFQLLANSLAQKRLLKHGSRLSGNIDNKGKKLNDITRAEESLLRQNEMADANHIANLELQDKIQMSTITLQIYQRESATRELIENEVNIESFEPGFGSKFAEAIAYGWGMIKAFILFLARIWGILLIIAVVVFAVRKIFPNIFK